MNRDISKIYLPFIVVAFLSLSLAVQVGAQVHLGLPSAVKSVVKKLKSKKNTATVSSIVLSPLARVLTSDTNSKFLGVSSDSATYRYDIGASQFAALRAGDIMLSSQGDGLLRKIISITPTPTEYTILTTTATLEETFEKLDATFNQTFAPSGVNPRYLKGFSPQGASLGQFEISTSVALSPNITADATLTFTPAIDGKIKIEGFQLREFVFTSIFDGSLELALTATAAGMLTKEIKVAEFPLGTVMVGPVPVVPSYSVNVGVEASLQAAVATSVTQEVSFESGVQYVNGVWTPHATLDNNFVFTPPVFSAEGAVKAYIAPAINAKILNVAGPYVDAEGYLKGLVTTPVNHLPWEVKGGISINAGAKVEVLSWAMGEWGAELYSAEIMLASGALLNQTPAITAVTPNPTSISAGATTTITCSASDVDGDTLTYSWSAASGTLSSTIGNPVTWIAPVSSGTYIVSVIVSDSYGGTVQSSTNVVVIEPVNKAPILIWTGEANYVSDGLSPEVGYSTDTFVYQVKYLDLDDDPPGAGYPKVHIKKDGVAIIGSPFAMTYVTGNHNAGSIYSYSRSLSSGTDYTYYFEARDSSGAVAEPTVEIDAPDISQGTDTAWSVVSAGAFHTVAVKADGTLWAWGFNGYGQLGLGDTVTKLSPTQVGSEPNWGSVSVGAKHTLAIKTDGTLWAWGYNSSGQLGVGDTTNRVMPTQVGVGTNWASVSAGNSYSSAIKTDGTLWAWGDNSSGQLGVGDTTVRFTPTQIGAGTNWASVSAGFQSALAIRTDGTLWAWGDGSNGVLGLGDNIGRLAPAQIGSGTNWASVSVGSMYASAIKTDRTLWVWGKNSYGSLGLVDNVDRFTPTQVGSETDWDSVSSSDGGWHTVAVRTDGTLWAWGYNSSGQLGLGDTTNRVMPTQVGVGTNWASVSAGGWHTSAVRADGTIWDWGYNENGQLGFGDTTHRLTPTDLTATMCVDGGDWLLVLGDPLLGTNDFYVMKYEAKNVGGFATSQADGNPWVSITHLSAVEACAALGSGVHLLTIPEVQTINRNIESQAANWADGVIGSLISAGGGLKRGNVGVTDGASYDGADPEYGIGRNTKAKLVLSNGSELWDWSGNVDEWVYGAGTEGRLGTPDGVTFSITNWYEWNNIDLNEERTIVGPSDGSWTSENGVGKYYGGGATLRATRGGSWGRLVSGGVFYFNGAAAPTGSGADIGFRCAR